MEEVEIICQIKFSLLWWSVARRGGGFTISGGVSEVSDLVLGDGWT